MPEITVQLDHPDGTTEAVQLDLSLETLTMREAARLEEVLGDEAFHKLTTEGITPSPRIIQALVYIKLRALYPEVALDGFDLSLEELQAAFEEEEEEEPPPLSVASGGGSKR